jgi:hypothetical protein
MPPKPRPKLRIATAEEAAAFQRMLDARDAMFKRMIEEALEG